MNEHSKKKKNNEHRKLIQQLAKYRHDKLIYNLRIHQEISKKKKKQVH